MHDLICRFGGYTGIPQKFQQLLEDRLKAYEINPLTPHVKLPTADPAKEWGSQIALWINFRYLVFDKISMCQSQTSHDSSDLYKQ